MNPPALFTAARISACLARRPQSVRRALRNVKPSGLCLVNGKETATWTLAALPPTLRGSLDAAARQRRYRDALTMLASPPAPYKSPVPLERVAQREIDHANKLRTAQAPSILRQRECDLTSDEFERRGVIDFAKVFDYRITQRHWRTLFQRTIQRDAGAEDYSRLELYISDRPALKELPAPKLSDVQREEFQGLLGLINTLKNPAALSLAQKRAVWGLAVTRHRESIRQGLSSNQATRRVTAFLFSRLPTLARSRNALRVAFNRKLERGIEGNRDGRTNRGSLVKIPEADLNRLRHSAAFKNGGHIDAAWREEYPNLSEQTRSHYGPSRRCPRKICQLLKREKVDALTARRQGKLTLRRMIGGVQRDWSEVAAMHLWAVDDVTCNLEVVRQNRDGSIYRFQPQLVLTMDCASRKFVGWAISDDKGPTAEMSCESVLDGFRKYGVPKCLGVENGFVFGKSLLINGKEDEQGRTLVSGLAQYGCEIHHFGKMNPRAKGELEKSIDLLQRLMERHYGYTGRDQRRDAPEEFKLQQRLIDSGKIEATDCRYTFEEGVLQLEKMIDEYNATPQYGELKGLSPNEAFAALKNHSDPPIEFTPELEWLLANKRARVMVKVGGVHLPWRDNGRNVRVAGGQLANLIGKELWAMMDRHDGSLVTFMNLDFSVPFTMEVCGRPAAREKSTAPGSGLRAAERAKLREHERAVDEEYNRLLNTLGDPRQELLREIRNLPEESAGPEPTRRLIVPPRMAASAEQMQQQREEIRTARNQSARRNAANKSKARRQGIPTVLVGDDEQSRRALELLSDARPVTAEEAASAEGEEI